MTPEVFLIGLQVFATCLSISGGICIIFKNRAGYAVWMISNNVWIWIFIKTGLWISIIPFVFYQGMNIWGWLKWGKE